MAANEWTVRHARTPDPQRSGERQYVCQTSSEAKRLIDHCGWLINAVRTAMMQWPTNVTQEFRIHPASGSFINQHHFKVMESRPTHILTLLTGVSKDREADLRDRAPTNEARGMTGRSSSLRRVHRPKHRKARPNNVSASLVCRQWGLPHYRKRAYRRPRFQALRAPWYGVRITTRVRGMSRPRPSVAPHHA